MISSAFLKEFKQPIRFIDGKSISLSSIQDSIIDYANNEGIPVAIRKEQVKSGGMFDKTIEDCIIVSHPEHQHSYFEFCIKIKRIGVFAFVYIFKNGKSDLMAEENKSNVNIAMLEYEQMYYVCISDIFDRVLK